MDWAFTDGVTSRPTRPAVLMRLVLGGAKGGTSGGRLHLRRWTGVPRPFAPRHRNGSEVLSPSFSTIRGRY
jgi:hypothetical protein